jgi:hypothetical protein
LLLEIVGLSRRQQNIELAKMSHDQASTRTTGQIGFGMTSASQHLVALIWALLLGLLFLGGIAWWWVNARRPRRRRPDLGILTALHQEREPERSGREV